MSDQCGFCNLSGDIEKCRKVVCFQQVNWYALEQIKEIDRLGCANIDLAAEIETLKTANGELVEAAKEVIALFKYSDYNLGSPLGKLKALIAKVQP